MGKLGYIMIFIFVIMIATSESRTYRTETVFLSIHKDDTLKKIQVDTFKVTRNKLTKSPWIIPRLIPQGERQLRIIGSTQIHISIRDSGRTLVPVSFEYAVVDKKKEEL